MTRSRSRYVPALVLAALLPFAQTTPLASSAPAGTVDPNSVHIANFEGWGTSLAWGANVVGGWSDPRRAAIADRLFSPTSGLGLNVVRYHIGAGQNPDWQQLGCGAHRPGSPVPTYQPSPGGWDWTADANQRWFAQAAKARGADKWLAYASSPPSWMTISGCTNGGAGGGQNLKGWWGYDGDGTGAYNSSTSYSNSTNDSVTVRFTGTQISFHAAKSSDSGRAAISIDGGAETIVDLYSATRQGNQLVYTSPVLSSGTHTLTVRVTGTKNQAAAGVFVSPDRVVVSPGNVSVDDQTRGTGLNQFNYHWHMYEPFADYLTEVIKHFRDSWGIAFNLLDPVNEPENAWSKTGNQEGAHFDQNSQDEIINRVGQNLAAKGLTGTRVAAPDGFSVATTKSYFDNYSPSAKDYISTITTHTYSATNDDRFLLRKAATDWRKKLWMSEFGTGETFIGQPPQYTDPEKAQPAINLASRIVDDLTVLRPEAWILWDGIESWEQNSKENVSWGLIWAKYLDTSETYTIAKQYYGYGNFTKFIRPGYRIIESGDPTTLAAYDPVGHKLVLVAYNNGTTSRSLTYDLSKFDGITGATPYRTSDTERLAPRSAIPVHNNKLSVTLKPKSITTYAMPNATASPT